MKVKLTEDELLSSVSEHTTRLKGEQWLKHLRYNEKNYGFKKTLTDLPKSPRKGLVLGAGPGFKQFGMTDLDMVTRHRLIHGADSLGLIACDGALSTLSLLNHPATFVVTVDSHPVVANFFRRNRHILSTVEGVLLCTSIHRDVVETCIEAGLADRLYWWQPWFKENGDVKRGSTSMKNDSNLFYREGVSSIFTGGNVGTSSFIIASQLLKWKPIGLMGLEFAWSDETPLMDLQYFVDLKKALGEDADEDEIRSQYVVVKNPRDGLSYMADPVYYTYFLAWKDLWRRLPEDVRRNTFNLTVQGILNIKGLDTINVEEFLKK